MTEITSLDPTMSFERLSPEERAEADEWMDQLAEANLEYQLAADLRATEVTLVAFDEGDDLPF